MTQSNVSGTRSQYKKQTEYYNNGTSYYSSARLPRDNYSFDYYIYNQDNEIVTGNGYGDMLKICSYDVKELHYSIFTEKQKTTFCDKNYVWWRLTELDKNVSLDIFNEWLNIPYSDLTEEQKIFNDGNLYLQNNILFQKQYNSIEKVYYLAEVGKFQKNKYIFNDKKKQEQFYISFASSYHYHEKLDNDSNIYNLDFSCYLKPGIYTIKFIHAQKSNYLKKLPESISFEIKKNEITTIFIPLYFNGLTCKLSYNTAPQKIIFFSSNSAGSGVGKSAEIFFIPDNGLPAVNQNFYDVTTGQLVLEKCVIQPSQWEGTSSATFLTTNNEYATANTLSNGVIFKRDSGDGTTWWEYNGSYRTLSNPLPGYLETLPNGTENSSDYWYRNDSNPQLCTFEAWIHIHGQSKDGQWSEKIGQRIAEKTIMYYNKYKDYYGDKQNSIIEDDGEDIFYISFNEGVINNWLYSQFQNGNTELPMFLSDSIFSIPYSSFTFKNFPSPSYYELVYSYQPHDDIHSYLTDGTNYHFVLSSSSGDKKELKKNNFLPPLSITYYFAKELQTSDYTDYRDMLEKIKYGVSIYG